LYKKIVDRFPGLHFIASGGIRSLDDIYLLEELGCKGAIVGKAIYEGFITLKDLANVN
jgi:phosphoribosylformimino-5-aminoimidazole carboxamide ribotide isomerase